VRSQTERIFEVRWFLDETDEVGGGEEKERRRRSDEMRFLSFVHSLFSR
jgi:hypothetical protein